MRTFGIPAVGQQRYLPAQDVIDRQSYIPGLWHGDADRCPRVEGVRVVLVELRSSKGHGVGVTTDPPRAVIAATVFTAPQP